MPLSALSKLFGPPEEIASGLLAETPIRILTIPEGKHRLLRTQERLELFGITHAKPFFGISKFESGFQRHCLYDPTDGDSSGLTDGAIACAMTHIHMWSYIIRKELSACLILEDDEAIEAESLALMEKIFAALPSDAHLAICHSWGVDEAIKIDFGNPHWWRTRKCSNTASAYYLTNAGARRLLRSCIPYWQPIDQMIQAACTDPEMNAYQVKQPLFNQDYTMGSLINE